jgi:2-oxoglutarate dehydrogenase E2 component (dihydrolipoamide succinyltransferase)
MGESIAEGTLSKWLRRSATSSNVMTAVRDLDRQGRCRDPRARGWLFAEIKVQEGQTMPVQTLVAVLETEAGAVASSPRPRHPPRNGRAKPAAPQATPAPTPSRRWQPRRS